MKFKILLCCLPLVVGIATEAQEPDAENSVYRLYFLGGQSNMEGFGFVNELPDAWRTAVDRVMIYTGKMVGDNEPGGGVGSWGPLKPGNGTGFDTDGRENALSDRFGPELAFGRRLAELDTTARVAIIKYSRGGSSLQLGASGYGTWDPDFDEGAGINQYDNALTAISTALGALDIDGDGVSDELIPAGIIWMQGESDAYHSEATAKAYKSNLKRMMDLLRAALRADDLPVVIGKIVDSGQDDDELLMDHIDIVHDAQQAYVAEDDCASFVTLTENFRFLDDGWHYETEDYIRLGTAFADAVSRLGQSCPGDEVTP